MIGLAIEFGAFASAASPRSPPMRSAHDLVIRPEFVACFACRRSANIAMGVHADGQEAVPVELAQRLVIQIDVKAGSDSDRRR